MKFIQLPGVRARVSDPRSWHSLALLGLLGLALLALAWQSPHPVTLDVGATDSLYLQDFYPAEAGPSGLFRWSKTDSGVVLPGLGAGRWLLTLNLATGRPAGTAAPTVAIRDGSGQLTASFCPTNRNFQLYQAPNASVAGLGGDLILDIATTPTYSPPGDHRTLGIAVDSLSLAPAGPILPAPLPLLALVAAVIAFTLALRQVVRPRAAFLSGVALCLVLALVLAWNRIWVVPFAGYILLICVTLAVGVFLLRAIMLRYAGFSGSLVANPERFMLVVLLAIALGYALVAFATQLAVVFNQPGADDFAARWQSATTIGSGAALYDVAGLRQNPFLALYKYPPLFAGLIRPLTLFSFATARDLWRSFDTAALLAAVAVLVATFGGPRLPWRRAATGDQPALTWRQAIVAPAALSLLLLTFLFRPALDAINYGQLDPPILLLLALTLAALRADKPFLAGPPLALAVALKIYPVLLIVYLLWRREWHALAGFAAALVAWMLLGALLTSPLDTWVYLTQVLPISGGGTAWVENQTLNGLLARLFTDRIVSKPFPADLQLRSLLLPVLTYAAGAAVLALTLFLAGRPTGRRSASYTLGFAATITASIFILPAAWWHYMTALLLPLAAVFYLLQSDGLAWWLAAPRRALAALLLLALGALLLAYDNPWLLYNGQNLGGLWTLILSYKLYGAVALWSGLLLLLRLSRLAPTASFAATATVPIPDAAPIRP